MDEPGGAADVLRSGTSQVINEITDELLEQSVADPSQLEPIRELGMRAAMIVPMVAGGRTIGVISFVSAESRRTFSAADLELAEELGRRAGTAVENARLYTERSHIADTLQASLLPAGAAGDARLQPRVAVPAGGRGELGRRRLLRRVPDRDGLDGRGRRRRRAAAPRRRR